MMRLIALTLSTVAAQETTLTISVGTQGGFFGGAGSKDIGSLNPHDYRPNEFVTSDFIFEGLVEWDGLHTTGVDNVAGNEDDFVKPALAASWTHNKAAVKNGSATVFDITFTLRPGVTFHDGSVWDAAACKANFDLIMGSDGTYGAKKAMKGMHDWLGYARKSGGVPARHALRAPRNVPLASSSAPLCNRIAQAQEAPRKAPAQWSLACLLAPLPRLVHAASRNRSKGGAWWIR